MQVQRYLTFIVVALLIIAALFYGFRPQPIMVETAPVTRGPLQVFVEEEGKTRVTDRYEVTAPVAGTTCRLGYEVGDEVELGQTLLMLEPLQSQPLDARSRAQAEARVAAAESSLRAAEQAVKAAGADAALAKTEVNRIGKLFKQGHISRGQLDQAEARTRSTEAVERSATFNVDVALHELEVARTALKYSSSLQTDVAAEKVKVTSPIDGRILSIQHKCEGVVQAGQPLLEVGDTSALEVVVNVLSADAVRIEPGMRVLFEHWGGEQTLEGMVTTVEPVGFTKVSALGVEEQRVRVIVEFTSDPELWRRVGDGYRVEGKFILWEADDVLQIPASALFRYKDGWAVFVANADKAELRQVEPGERNGLVAGIQEGLAENEQVITHPDDSLENGRSIEIRE